MASIVTHPLDWSFSAACFANLFSFSHVSKSLHIFRPASFTFIDQGSAPITKASSWAAPKPNYTIHVMKPCRRISEQSKEAFSLSIEKGLRCFGFPFIGYVLQSYLSSLKQVEVGSLVLEGPVTIHVGKSTET